MAIHELIRPVITWLPAGMNATYAADPAYQTIALHRRRLGQQQVRNNLDKRMVHRHAISTISRLSEKVCRYWAVSEIMKAAVYPCLRNTGRFRFVNPSRTYYSFDYGPVHVTVIDQYTDLHCRLGTVQLARCRPGRTAQSRGRLLFSISPAGLAAGGHENDTTVQGTIQPLCVTYGVQIVLGGHVHYYSRAVVSGIQHVTNGAGGASAYTPVGVSRIL